MRQFNQILQKMMNSDFRFDVSKTNQEVLRDMLLIVTRWRDEGDSNPRG